MARALQIESGVMTRLRTPATLSALLALLLGACGIVDVDGGSGDDAGDDDADDDAAATTYYRDVYPILQSRCAGCHREGGIGTFTLDEDPDNAQAYAPLIAQSTTARIMPPFLPGELSPALRDDMRLSDAEIATLSAWSEAGAPLGDPADKVPVDPPAGFPLDDADLAFDIGLDYTPDPALTDDYRCFAVPIDVAARRMSIGYRITPGSARVVHHVIVSLVSADDARALADLDAETERAGWPCFGGPVPQDSGIEVVGRIGSWTPGQDGRLTYPGTATPVPANVIAIVGMHYNTLNGVDADRTRVEVFLEPEETQAELLPLGGAGAVSRDIDIPADESEVRVTATRTIAEWRAGAPTLGDAWAVGAAAHAHLLMTRHRLTLNAGTPDERILLDIPRWSFHWQGQWLYQEPIPVRAEDTLTIDCTYDNSPEHRSEVGLDSRSVPVSWGEGTTDEMCLGGIALVAENPDR
jgi:mono/diheme cytochrome c family protein